MFCSKFRVAKTSRRDKLVRPDSVAYNPEAKSLCERAAILMEHPTVIKCLNGKNATIPGPANKRLRSPFNPVI